MAQLDPSIILQGHGVNALGAIAAANEAAAFKRDALHQRDYRNMLAQNGAGIMAGDQGAMNALAGYDPAAAMGIMGQRQDMQFTQQRMDMLTEQEKRAAAEYARGLSADQAAAEAAMIEGTVKQALMLPDAASWDAFMLQNGQADLVGQFANRQALAGKYMSMAEVLKQAFPAPISPNERFKVAGNTLFDLGAEGGPAPVGQGAMPQETIYGPDGKPIIVRGGPEVGSVKLTEGQSKDLVYWQRATGSSPTIDTHEGDLAGLKDNIASGIPLVGNYMVSEGYQKGKQAAAEWLAAILRKDTGAAITSQEFDLYGPMYLPMPGDSDATLEQKREARKRAEEAIRLGLGTAEVLAQEVDRRRAAAEPPPEAATTSEIPQGFSDNPAIKNAAEANGLTVQELWDAMTPEQRAKMGG